VRPDYAQPLPRPASVLAPGQHRDAGVHPRPRLVAHHDRSARRTWPPVWRQGCPPLPICRLHWPTRTDWCLATA